ncbi:MAG TPA: VTT domain-containing protein [Thermoanaerobaculia bacterium]|nr:VTT domain-containing protein [Thermoanaerobaculia bacterium]
MATRRVAKIALAVVLAAAVAAIYFSPLREYLTRDEIRQTVDYLRGFWYGPLVFMGLYAIGCIFAVPASIFVLGAGAIWGWKLGGVYSLIGGMAGATISFFAGRFIGEGLLARFGRLGRMVARQVDHAGFKSLLILRFIPGLPFAVLNYGSGVCGVRLGDFAAATFLGSAPSVFVFAYCADALINGVMTEGEAAGRLVIVAVLMIAIVVIPGLVKRWLRPEMRPESQ